MTTVYLWWALLHLWLSCADDIKYLYQHSKCYQCRSRRKPIHFKHNDTLSCQCGWFVSLIILLMKEEKLFTLHWPSCSGCSWERVSVHFDYKCSQYSKHRLLPINNNSLHLTVGYQNATNNRNTRKQEQDVGSEGSSQTWQTTQVDRYRFAFGPPGSGWLGYWTVLEPKWTIYLV